MSERIAAMLCVAGAALATPVWGQVAQDATVSGGTLAAAPSAPAARSAARYQLALPSGARVYSTDNAITNVRTIQVQGSSTVLMLWDEAGPRGAEPHYAVSFDGRTLAGNPTATTYTVRLRYMNFDPMVVTPNVPAFLQALPSSQLYLVQFQTTPLPELQEIVRSTGASVLRFLSDHTLIVFMSPQERAQVEAMPFVRWVGRFHPAYKMDESILESLDTGSNIDVPGRYSVECFEEGLGGQNAVAAKVTQLGGQVNMTSPDGYRMEITLTPAQLVEIAKMDEVHFMDPWGPGGHDMDIVRQIGGANFIESTLGFTGQGVRAEVFDSELRTTHQEFSLITPLTHSGTFGNAAEPHGTSVFSIMFARGASAAARGLLPDSEEQIFYWYGQCTQFGGPQTRLAANTQLLAAPYNAVVQTSSIGSPQTTVYTTISAETDNYLFLQPLLSTQSQSNTGNQNSRPQAWAKNIVSCGAVDHFNTLTRVDDTRSGTSIGPAADGRLKPDLLFFYDLTFAADNASNVAYTQFGGTSGATPSCGGYFGLFHQMWHNGVWAGRGGASTVFTSRPKPTTAKAAMCNTAFRYNWLAGGANGNITRAVQGWGMPDLQNMYGLRTKTFIVDQQTPILPLATHTYMLRVNAGEPTFNATMSYPDPQGPASATQHRINDLSLRVTAPDGTIYWGNNGLTAGNFSTSGGVANTKDTVENVFVQNPIPGAWKVEVIGSEIVADGHLATGAIDAIYSLWVTGVEGGRAAGPFAEGGVADHFNRADGPIASDWSAVGTANLANFTTSGGAGAHSAAAGVEFIQNDAFQGDYRSGVVWADAIMNGTANQFVAVASGLGGSDYFYAKVQAQTGTGRYSHVAFYRGSTNGPWAGGLPFTALGANEFSQGRIRLSVSPDGDTASLDVDTNFDGVADFTYTSSGLSGIASGFGKKFGLGAWQGAVYDNWNATHNGNTDNFNRANGALGAPWAGFSGTFANFTINNNAGAHTSAVLGDVIRYNGSGGSGAYNAKTQWVDVITNGTSLQYVGLAVGLGGTNYIYVKAQAQTGTGRISNLGFYQGSSNGAWPGMTGGSGFFAVDSEFAAARCRLSISADGDLATFDIDTDFDGVPDQSYSRGGLSGLAASFGTGFGITAYGPAVYDNYALLNTARDNFNRPNGAIGGSWAPNAGPIGSFGVSGNAGIYTGGASASVIQNNGWNAAIMDHRQWVDVGLQAGAGVSYVALCGGLGGTDNYFIKVQQNGAGTGFNTAGFYQGNNGGGWAGMTGGASFFTLSSAFTSGRVRVTVGPDGDTITLDIDTDFDGVTDQSYSRGGLAGLKAGFGTRYGIGAFGQPTFDNWNATPGTATCYPDCDGSGTLTIADFGCFQTKFVQSDPYADCDGSGTFTIADFGCFQTKFVQGCP